MTIQYISNNDPDGTVIGTDSGDLIGFYGATPSAKGGAITTVQTFTTTVWANSINSLIARLQTLGLNA